MKKLVAVIAAAVIFSGCSAKSDPQASTSLDEENAVEMVTGAAAATEEETTVLETTAPVTEEIAATESADEYSFTVLPGRYTEYSELFEAENGNLGSGEKADIRENFSASGYVSAYGDGTALRMLIEVPATQHYDLTVRAASDEPGSGRLICDGGQEYAFSLSGNGEFEALKFDSIYLSEGAHELAFLKLSAKTDIDCVLLESTDALDKLEIDISEDPVTPNASENTQKLYNYLKNIFGSATLSAQQCTQGTDVEIDIIYDTLGKYPAIRFGELGGYTSGADTGDVELALKWAENGGIVGFSWYWELRGSLYSDAFSLKDAVTELDIAAMDGEALAGHLRDGDISEGTLLLIEGIDAAASQLCRLRDAGVPVILRALPEAASGMFWWGSDPDSFKWLYRLIFDRFSYYHKLDNIIWAVDGSSADFYPGDGYADILTVDLYYPEKELSGGTANFYSMLYAVSGKKMFAVSECNILPDPENMAQDGCRWLFCSLFSGQYALSPDGTLCTDNMPPEGWRRFYLSDAVISRAEIR